MHLTDNFLKKVVFITLFFFSVFNISSGQNTDSCFIYGIDSVSNNPNFNYYNCIILSETNRPSVNGFEYRDLDRVISLMPKLNTIYFYSSSLKKIPNSLIGNKLIETIYVFDDYNGKISSDFYFNFCKIDDIKRIEIVSKSVKRFPIEYKNLKKLKVLYVANLNCKKIPAFKAGFDSLEELMIAGQHLKLNNTSIFSLKNLNYLRLEISGVNKLPFDFMRNSKIENLDLSFLTKSDFVEFFNKVDNNQIETLTISSLLDSIPAGIYKLNKLKNLSVKINSLDALQYDKIKELKMLSVLDIHIPKDYKIGDKLVKLETLLSNVKVNTYYDL